MEVDRSASQEWVTSAYPRYNAAVLGFREYWYPVLHSEQLTQKPVPVKLLGEKVVVFRDRGAVYALQDRCPHRGVPLSEGHRLFPGTVSCRYHGWTYELRTGQLVAALTDGPDSPICGKDSVCVRTYPVADRAGLIWIFVGDGAPPPVEADIPSELLQPNTYIQGVVQARRGHWRYAMENGIDEGHARYLHRQSAWTLFRDMPAWTRIHMEITEDDWLVRVVDDVQFRGDFPGVGVWPPPPKPWQSRARGNLEVGIRLPCLLRIKFKGWWAYECYVPIDEAHHRAILFGATWVNGVADRLAFKARYWSYIRWLYHGQFNSQDVWAVENTHIPPERLYRPDVSITAWRKLCQERARSLSQMPAAIDHHAAGREIEDTLVTNDVRLV